MAQDFQNIVFSKTYVCSDFEGIFELFFIIYTYQLAWQDWLGRIDRLLRLSNEYWLQ
jgi:hypothetical protein